MPLPGTRRSLHPIQHFTPPFKPRAVHFLRLLLADPAARTALSWQSPAHNTSQQHTDTWTARRSFGGNNADLPSNRLLAAANLIRWGDSFVDWGSPYPVSAAAPSPLRRWNRDAGAAELDAHLGGGAQMDASALDEGEPRPASARIRGTHAGLQGTQALRECWLSSAGPPQQPGR